MMPRPAHCDSCQQLRILQGKRRRQPIIHIVETWCHACGQKAVLELEPPYSRAVAYLRMLHGQQMVHEAGDHTESGGWGYLWRLDDVLSIAFPKGYANDPSIPHWPVPPWEERRMALGRPVNLLDPSDLDEIVPGELGFPNRNRRAELFTRINAAPKGRIEMEALQGTVWDDHALRREFRVGGAIPPFMLVVRRADRVTGSVLYQETPRLYWDFQPATKRVV
jgi:hypothetical protein